MARAVKLAQEDGLEVAEQERTVSQRNRHRGRRQSGTHVRPRIALPFLFGVLSIPFFVNESL